MNRFVKNNLVLIIVLGLSLVVTVALLVWTTMQYLQMLGYIRQTEQLRGEVAKLIEKKPAPVEGNLEPIEMDRKFYSERAAQIRVKFGHPLQPALEKFITVLQKESRSEITLEKFKEEFAAAWNSSELFAQKNNAYGIFKNKFGDSWGKAMEKFQEEAKKATAEPINAENINEIFQCALGVPRKLEGNPNYLLRMMTNFREGMLALAKDKIQFDNEEATSFSFSFENAKSAAAAAAVIGGGGGSNGSGGGETQNDYQVDNYPMIAQHWEILSDIVKRSTESGIHSFVSFRKRSVQPEKSGSFDVFHYSIEVTGTMESVRKLTTVLDQAYHENRVYVVRSVFLYQLEDDALPLLKPELVTDKQAAEERPASSRRRGRGGANASSESAEEQQARELAEHRAQEIAKREESLPYYSRSSYGMPVIGKNDLVRAIVDVEYVMESGSGI